MKILFAGMRWNYGRPEQGASFEYDTFYDVLEKMGHEVLLFDFLATAQEHGRESTNRRLWETVESEDPDLMFSVLFGDELDPEVVSRISRESRTVTLNWFCDDHWRFHDFSARWAPHFNWVATTAPAEVAPYEALGLHHVVRTQWACNPFRFRKLEGVPRRYDVTFVGMAHGDRPRVVEDLRAAGVDVRVWGAGWPDGRLQVEEMVRVFNQSRVNLNFAGASVTEEEVRRRSTRWGRARGRARKALEAAPGHGYARAALRRARPGRRPGRSAPPRYVPQIKARNFEIAGSGAFLLTEAVEGLDRYFVPGREIATFGDTTELVELVRHHLAHEDEREAIAAAGHARVLREHTYEYRFAEIFSRAGLPPFRPPHQPRASGAGR